MSGTSAHRSRGLDFDLVGRPLPTRVLMSSVLYIPLTGSAGRLSYESSREPHHVTARFGQPFAWRMGRYSTLSHPAWHRDGVRHTTPDAVVAQASPLLRVAGGSPARRFRIKQDHDDRPLLVVQPNHWLPAGEAWPHG